jgi:hypothetical protein
MNETIGQGGGMAALPPRGIGEILSTAFQLYRRYWRNLLAIAAVVVVPLTLLQYGIGHWVRSHGQQLHGQVVVSTSFWAVASATLLAPLAGLLLYQVLTGAITRSIATEVTGQDLDLEQSYRFGFARLGPILVVSILVGLATLIGLIVFIIPGIYIGVRLAVSIQALVVGAGGEPRPCAAAGIWSVATVARGLHPARRCPDHRGGERRDHRTVRRRCLVRPRRRRRTARWSACCFTWTCAPARNASTSTPSRPTCRPRRPDLQVMLKASIEPRWV